MRYSCRGCAPRRFLSPSVLRLFQREAAAFFSDFEIYTAEDRVQSARVTHHKV